MARNVRKMVVRNYALTYTFEDENGEFVRKTCYTTSNSLRNQLAAIKHDSGLSDTAFMFNPERNVKEFDDTFYIIDINKAIELLLANGLAVTEEQYRATSDDETEDDEQ